MNWLQNYYSQLSCICTVVVLKTSETVNCLDGRFLFLISPTLSQGASHSSFFARRMNKRALSSSWPILLWILKKPKGLQSLVLHLKADANGFYGKQASKQQQKDEFKCGFHGFWIISQISAYRNRIMNLCLRSHFMSSPSPSSSFLNLAQSSVRLAGLPLIYHTSSKTSKGMMLGRFSRQQASEKTINSKYR